MRHIQFTSSAGSKFSLVLAFSLGLLPFLLSAKENLKTIALPAPQITGGKPLMQALSERKTSREYKSTTLPPQLLSNLLWAAFGINRPISGERTAPSAHGAKEIEIYVVIPEGAYLYDPHKNILRLQLAGDIRAATGIQDFAKTAPLNLVYVSDFSKFPKDSEADRLFYSAADAGFISQNVYLFCASEGLATMVRAYINKPALKKILRLTANQHVMLAQSVGYSK